MLDTSATPVEMLKWLSERNHHIPKEDLAFMLGIQFCEKGTSDPYEPFDFDEDDYGDFSATATGAI